MDWLIYLGVGLTVCFIAPIVGLGSIALGLKLFDRVLGI